MRAEDESAASSQRPDVGTPIGLTRGKTVFRDYDSRWPGEYAREEAALSLILGDVAAAIEHIGSTAVPGLTAKPMPRTRSSQT